jgi:hypothetical protein
MRLKQRRLKISRKKKKKKKGTWSLDDTVLVRFGGVAVSRPVNKTLHHFRAKPLRRNVKNENC